MKSRKYLHPPRKVLRGPQMSPCMIYKHVFSHHDLIETVELYFVFHKRKLHISQFILKGEHPFKHYVFLRVAKVNQSSYVHNGHTIPLSVTFLNQLLLKNIPYEEE